MCSCTHLGAAPCRAAHGAVHRAPAWPQGHPVHHPVSCPAGRQGGRHQGQSGDHPASSHRRPRPPVAETPDPAVEPGPRARASTTWSVNECSGAVDQRDSADPVASARSSSLPTETCRILPPVDHPVTSPSTASGGPTPTACSRPGTGPERQPRLPRRTPRPGTGRSHASAPAPATARRGAADERPLRARPRPPEGAARQRTASSAAFVYHRSAGTPRRVLTGTGTRARWKYLHSSSGSRRRQAAGHPSPPQRGR